MSRLKRTIGLTIGCAVTASLVATTGTAFAATDDAQPTVVSSGALLTGEQFERADQRNEHARARDDARADFVAEQMRSGRLVDLASTSAGVVDGVQTAWERGLKIDSVEIREARTAGSSEAFAQDLSVKAHPDGSDSSTPTTATSLGLNGALSVSGATFQNGYCTTTTSATGNKLTGCFQKYRLSTATSTRDFYYYNRYATAVGKAISWGLDWKPTKIDVRARPWSGQSGQVAALVDYWPKAGVKSCDDHSITVGYGSFSAQMPIQDCNEVNPSPDAVAKSMTVIYDQGAVFDGRVHGTDMSLVYSTFKSKNPAYADYTYAKFCKGTYATCDGVLRKDSGW